MKPPAPEGRRPGLSRAVLSVPAAVREAGAAPLPSACEGAALPPARQAPIIQDAAPLTACPCIDRTHAGTVAANDMTSPLQRVLAIDRITTSWRQ